LFVVLSRDEVKPLFVERRKINLLSKMPSDKKALLLPQLIGK